MLESRSFDVCKNTTAPMIAILDCSKIDMEVSGADMEIVESNN